MDSRTKKWLIGGVMFGGLVLFLLDALLLEHFFFKVKTFKIQNAANADRRVRILHLTDLHFTSRLSWKYRKLATRINKINPDIIFISGDSVDKSGRLEPLEKFLRLIRYSIPKLAILGNHEYLAEVDLEKLNKIYRLVNGDLLVNRSKAYRLNGVRLMITGLDDLLEGEENFSHAVKDIGHEEHHFVLIHSPKHQEKIREQIERINNLRPQKDHLNIQAMFAGHNHGGQMRIGNFVPHLPPMSGDYIEGWYNEDQPYLYLSRGFGSSKVPMRLNAPAEITVFEYYC